MRLETLTVKGLLAIGGETSIDLRTLPPGLIALVGPNGNGKTTLLDAAPASIHRKMPSRSGKPLAQYASDRDSFIETTWAFDGRGLVKLRVALDGVRGTSKAVIVQMNADGSETPISDGSVSDFDEKVATLFPPRDVLLASAVAAQNKAGSFSTIERHERQALFAKLLGLDRYKQMAETAKLLASKCDTARATLAGRRDILSREAAASVIDAIDLDLIERHARLELATTKRTELSARRSRLEQERAGYQEQAARYAQAQARRRQLSDLTVTEMQANSANMRKRDQATAAAESELNTAASTHRKTLADFDERIANNESVIGRAGEIREAAASAERLRQQIAGLDAELADLTKVLDGITTSHAAQVQHRRAVATADADLSRARHDAETLTSVPCGGRDQYAACSFLTRATAAAAQIPALVEQAALLQEIDAMIADCEAKRLEWLPKRTDKTRERASLQALLAEVEPSAKLLPNIETAEQRIVELRADRDRAVELHEASKTAIQTRLDQALAALKEESRVILDRIDAYGAELAQLEIVEDETKDAAEHLNRCDVDLAALASEWDSVTAQTATIDAAIADLERRREKFHAAQQELADVSARLRTVEDDLLDYQLLTKALGKDGLPTLEIDAAGPTVSAFCNDLLATCFGARFSVELVTQEATAKGGLKEAFELKVYDNERGGDPRDLEDLSGGEQIIIDEALKNAIAAFNNTRREPIETIFRDETTGPLDGANAANYLQMLRRLREMAGAYHMLFVTHNDDAKLQADAQIVVEQGQARIVLPPYAEVA